MARSLRISLCDPIRKALSLTLGCSYITRTTILGGFIMKKISLSSLLIFAFCITMLSACGGGGGGGGSTPPQPTTAVLTLSTAVTGTIPSDTTINGYDVTITLPAGVTVKSTTPPQTDAGVVTTTGSAAGSSMTAVYSAATGTTPGKVRILIANGDRYYAGEFSQVNCDIAAGHYPKASDFQQPTFAASGLLHTHLDYPDDIVTNVDLTGELSLTATAVIN
jgi:hypothetical protein